MEIVEKASWQAGANMILGLNIVGSRREELLEAFEIGDPSEPVPAFKHRFNVPLVGFVGFQDGAITTSPMQRLVKAQEPFVDD